MMKFAYQECLVKVALSAIVFFFSNSAFSVDCPKTSFEDLKSRLKGRGEISIVFFASWCVSCKPHLEQKHGEDTVFVAVFDEQERAEKVLRSFSVERLCFTSDGIGEALEVRSLPATRKISF